MQNRFFPQLPTERDEMRDKVIQRSFSILSSRIYMAVVLRICAP